MNIGQIIQGLVMGRNNPFGGGGLSSMAYAPTGEEADAPPGPLPPAKTTPMAMPTEAPVPETMKSPPDLASMYMELIESGQRNARWDRFMSGAALFGAGFPMSPQDRALMVGMSRGGFGGGDGSSSGSGAPSMRDLMEMQKMAQEREQFEAGLGELPAIGERYGLPPEVVEQMYRAGTLDELVSQIEQERAKPRTPIEMGTDKSGQGIYDPAAGKYTQIIPPVEEEDEYEWKDIGGGVQIRVHKKSGLPADQSDPANRMTIEQEDPLKEEKALKAWIDADRAKRGLPPMGEEEFAREFGKRGTSVDVHLGPEGWPDAPEDMMYAVNPDGTFKLDPVTKQPYLIDIPADTRSAAIEEAEAARAPIETERAGVDLDIARTDLQKKQGELEAERAERQQAIETQREAKRVAAGEAVFKKYASDVNLDNTIYALENETATSPITGITGNLAAQIPGSPAGVFRSDLSSLTAEKATDALKAMRQAAIALGISSGASGFGQITEREIAMLKALNFDLDPYRNSNESLKLKLMRIRRAMKLLATKNYNIENGEMEFRNDMEGFEKDTTPAPVGTDEYELNQQNPGIPAPGVTAPTVQNVTPAAPVPVPAAPAIPPEQQGIPDPTVTQPTIRKLTPPPEEEVPWWEGWIQQHPSTRR